MTPGANSLTARATPMAESFPSGRGRAVLEALAKLGYDVPLLATKAAGLSAADLEDLDATAVCNAVPAILELAFRSRPLPNAGIRLAAATPIGAYPLVDYLIVTSETVAAGMHHLARYLRSVGAPTSLTIADADDPVRVEFLGSGPFASFDVEYTAALIVLHLRQETATALPGVRAYFRHLPADPGEIVRILGCTIETQAAWDGLSLPPATWRLPLPRRDAVLHGILERHAEQADLAAGPGDFLAHVERAVAARLSRGEPSLQIVARDLAISSRTLQRRLSSAGTTFHRVLDGTRRAAAERYLTASRLSGGEVAYLLGYSEPAAFHRAFKRWHGVTPQAFRERRRGIDPSGQ